MRLTKQSARHFPARSMSNTCSKGFRIRSLRIDWFATRRHDVTFANYSSMSNIDAVQKTKPKGDASQIDRLCGHNCYIEPIGTMVPRVKNERSIMLKKKILMVVLLFLMAGTLMAQEAKVTSLMSKDLAENPGKELLMITVEHAPGGSSPIHRHNAHAMVYVLEGSVVMQLKGGKQVTLTPGQTFYEGPDDVHVVDRNASTTQPAKFLVFLIKDKGAPALVPVK